MCDVVHKSGWFRAPLLSPFPCREMKHIRKLSSLTAYTYFMNLVTVGGSAHIAQANTPVATDVSRYRQTIHHARFRLLYS